MNSGKEIFSKVERFKPKTVLCEDISKEYTIIDVRTPKEYNDHHIPSAISIPLVNTEEYHNVGYLYKQVSIKSAYDLGFDYIYQNIPEILEQANKHKNKKMLVYCARGGLRSKTVALLLHEQGFDVYQLHNGMKAYRNFVKDQLETVPIPKLIMLQGYAGARKTKFIEQLDNALNLEECAQHCSSVFGSIDHQPNSQKMFLFLLYENLKKIQNKPFVFIEAEARRIGSVEIPERVWKHMQSSPIIFLDVSLDVRAKHLAETYPSMKTYAAAYIERTKSLKKLIPKKVLEQLIQFIAENNPFAFWKMILKEYYDPRYLHAFKTQTFLKTINADDFEKTLKALRSIKG